MEGLKQSLDASKIGNATLTLRSTLELRLSKAPSAISTTLPLEPKFSDKKALLRVGGFEACLHLLLPSFGTTD